jgi:site-specific recombinase XerD
MSVDLLDTAGRRRSPATLPGYPHGCVPRNKGRRYPADPPRVEEIIAVMRAAGPGDHGDRIRALVVILWRAGLRINEALSLAETDLEPRRGSVLLRSRRCNTQPRLVTDGCARRTSTPRRNGRCTPTLCPHQLRHAHAVEMAREGILLPVIQRQLGHAHLGVTSTYLQGIDTTEIINTVHSRRAPVIPASAALSL